MTVARRRLLVGLALLAALGDRAGRAELAAALRAVRIRRREVPVEDAAGRRLRFWADVVGDSLAVLNPVFTRCSSLCPLTNAVMAELQDRLAELLGPRLRLVSLSIDPFGDSRAALSATARALGAGPHWLWIRAEPAALDALLRQLAPGAGRLDDHPPLFLLLDGPSGEALRADGIPPADRLAAAVRERLGARS